MKTIVAAAALVAVSVGTVVSFGQEPSRPVAQQTHVFRWLLKEKKLTPLEALVQLTEAPQQTILIALGKVDRLSELPEGLTVEEFVNAGGALLLATDREVPVARRAGMKKDQFGDSVRSLAAVTLPGFTVEAPDPPPEGMCHKDAFDRPFVVPKDETLADDANPFAGLKVATNIPAYLVHDVRAKPGARTTDLATLPGVCRLSDRRLFVNIWRQPWPFAVGGKRGDDGGRFLILADHSVFINEMLMAPDDDNLVFAVRTIEWLRAGVDGAEPRTRVLFLEDGEIQTSFDVPVKSLKPPPLPLLDHLNQLVEVADRQISTLQDKLIEREESGALDSWVVNHLAGGSDRRLLHVVAMFGTLALVLYGLYHLGESRRRHDAKLPSLAASLDKHKPAGGVLARRWEAQLAAGNHLETARLLARQRLDAQFGPHLAERPVATTGGWLRSWTATARVRRLWNLAHDDRTVRIGRREWKRFLADLDRLEADVERGLFGPRNPSGRSTSVV